MHVQSIADDDLAIKSAVAQFSTEIRDNAIRMAEYYKLFYMLENEIRRLIDETIGEKHGGPEWWETYAPQSAKDELKGNLQRER